MDDEEDEKKDKEQGSEDEDEGSDFGNSQIEKFSKKWLWIDWAVRVREIYGCPLNHVYEIGIIEFLNYICYLKDKNELELSQLKNKNTKKY